MFETQSYGVATYTTLKMWHFYATHYKFYIENVDTDSSLYFREIKAKLKEEVYVNRTASMFNELTRSKKVLEKKLIQSAYRLGFFSDNFVSSEKKRTTVIKASFLPKPL